MAHLATATLSQGQPQSVSVVRRAGASYWWAVLLGLFFVLAFHGQARAGNLHIGVFEAGNDPYALWAGVEWDNFVAKWNELSGKGLRLVDLETYVEGNKRLYSGVFRAGTDAHALWVGVEWDNFVAKWNELSRQGLRLIDLETYTEGRKRLYSGVFRAGTDAHALWGGVEWDNFRAKWDELSKQGLRLIDFETYTEGGKRLYAGVFRAGTDAHALWVGVEWDNFVAKWKEFARQGLRLIDIETYTEGSKRLYAGVFRAGSGGYALWAGVDWENFTAKWHELSGNNLRLIDLEVYPGECSDGCMNQVVMPTGSYNYGITSTPTHCAGLPGTCGTPGSGAMVTYRWPVDVVGSERYVRLSALEGDDAIFTLPFSDTAVKRRGTWLYEPGSWHHAIDYSRDDGNTFAIRAAAPGRVVHVGWDSWSGNTVIVSHDAGGVQDAYRTIYMHLRNGPGNDCNNAWLVTVPTLSGTTLSQYQTFLNDSGCTKNPATRSLKAFYWGSTSDTIPSGLLGQQVAAGALLGTAGNTGPGGCGCIDTDFWKNNTNVHLHIFFSHRDLTDNRWYFVDPSGIYGPPSCCPGGITDPINTACARYPVLWRDRRPQYPPLRRGEPMPALSVPEALDTNENSLLDDAEIKQAIRWWIQGETVAGTEQTIDDALMLSLVQMWVAGTPLSAQGARPAVVGTAEKFGVGAVRFGAPFQGVQRTLVVKGGRIAATQVQVFDLGGRLWVDQKGVGPSLNVMLADAAGVPLANGVYLYTVVVTGDAGQLWRSPLGKLVVLR